MVEVTPYCGLWDSSLATWIMALAVFSNKRCGGLAENLILLT